MTCPPADEQTELKFDPGVEARARQSPVDVAVPFWVTACVRLMPPQRDGRDSGTAADKVLTAAQVLLADRLRAAGDALVELKRDDLAAVTGYASAKKARWIVDYLVQIGFLVVHRHGGGGAGRKPDTFDVYERPPAHYVGPHTYVDLVRALRDPEQTFTKRLFVNPQISDGIPNGHLAVRASAPNGHLARNPQVSDGIPNGHLAQISSDQIDLLPPVGGREEIEPVAGGTAKPPATGKDERLAVEVREVIRRLDWRRWGQVKKGVTNYALTSLDADRIQAAMCVAIDSGQVDLNLATQIAQHALVEANAPIYLVKAFEAKLPEWVARLQVEPRAEDTLPWLGEAEPKPKSSAKPAQRQGTGAAASPDGGDLAKLDLVACETCRAEKGERYPSARTVTGEDGREKPCPDCEARGLCRPIAASAL